MIKYDSYDVSEDNLHEIPIKGKVKFVEEAYIYCPYIPLTVSTVVVTKKPRKLKASWTLELEDELKNLYFIGYEEILQRIQMKEYERKLKHNKFILEEEFMV